MATRDEEAKAIRAYKAAARKATVLSKKLGELEGQVWGLKNAALEATGAAKRAESELTRVLRGDAK